MSKGLKIVGILVLVILAVAIGRALSSLPGVSTPPAAARYHCPMHPTYVSDRGGDCPICGMRLVPMTGDDTHAAGGARAYSAPDAEPGGGEAAEPSGGVDGLAPVTVSEEGVRLAGIQTAPATRERIARTIRTVGEVVADETRIRHVHSKVPGWIERLYVSFTGQLVKEGEPILAIYSPELLSTQEEYLRTRAVAARFAASDLAEVRRGADDLVRAARRRLELFGVPEKFIAGIERTGEALRTVTMTAPASGFVTSKDVFQGQQIEPGLELYAITDLSHVWIEAAFYEFELGALSAGQQARLTLPYDPGTELAGRISYIYPYLDAASRTQRARIDVANPDMLLKPAMFANVELLVDSGEGIVVPDSAVMDTGDRQVVFVDVGGRFDPRRVEVGVRSDGRAQILSGIAEGERVVVRANFLLDSESRLRAAISGMDGEGAHPHGGASQ